MEQQSYFYQFIEPISKELALVARELRRISEATEFYPVLI
jgi:hypothetical protein